MKYSILLKTLDEICESAPSEFTSYKIDGSYDEINKARSKALIHLFLKVKCGISGFVKIHDLITEGTQDGGLDAYYIDTEKKLLYLIQSKFRGTEKNFENKNIASDDLVKMEIERILKGEDKDSRDVEFNDKIKAFQKEWSEISDQAHYKYIVIILGNLKNYTNEQIKRLINNSDYEIYNFERTYKELIFPLCSGTYYDPKEIRIAITLKNKEQPTLKQEIITNVGTFPVRILFVPTEEIGRIMHKYKNSILKYNPRNYLSLTQNKVNPKIRDSIVNSTSNDFAIYNNGITIITDLFQQTDSTGTKDIGQVIMTNPQIINGGQTAYVLSEIYKLLKDGDKSIFDGKEVMLKVIVLNNKTELNAEFIEKISNATNQQTRVEEADRRSNDKIQIFIQENIYDVFGYFYERKRGEFYNGINAKYINKSCIINRYDFLKSYLALKGDAANARRSGKETLFKEKRFKAVMESPGDFKRMFFAYRILSRLEHLSNEIMELFGLNLKYCKMAIIAAVGAMALDQEITKENVEKLAEDKIGEIASKWKDFEKVVKEKHGNNIYFSEEYADFDNYYKGSTVNSDIKDFFGKKQEIEE